MPTLSRYLPAASATTKRRRIGHYARLAGVLLAATAVLPLAVLARLDELIGSGEPLFSLGAHIVALFPGFVGNFLRSAFYWLTAESFYPTATLSYGSYCSTRRVVIGREVWVGAYCIIGRAQIDESTMIASRVSILSGRHQHGGRCGSGEVALRHGEITRIHIGRCSWIGEGAVVAADVGDNCIVGTGAVVIHPVGDLTTAVGNPARPLPRPVERPLQSIGI